MSSSDAQKSDVHATTGNSSALAADAPKAYPGGDNSGKAQPQEHSEPHPDAPGWDVKLQRPLENLLPGAEIVRDDTSDGGPLVIKSDDPELNPPRVPQDPFPTDRTPEIDPPV